MMCFKCTQREHSVYLPAGKKCSHVSSSTWVYLQAHNNLSQRFQNKVSMKVCGLRTEHVTHPRRPLQKPCTYHAQQRALNRKDVA